MAGNVFAMPEGDGSVGYVQPYVNEKFETKAKLVASSGEEFELGIRALLSLSEMIAGLDDGNIHLANGMVTIYSSNPFPALSQVIIMCNFGGEKCVWQFEPRMLLEQIAPQLVGEYKKNVENLWKR